MTNQIDRFSFRFVHKSTHDKKCFFLLLPLCVDRGAFPSWRINRAPYFHLRFLFRGKHNKRGNQSYTNAHAHARAHARAL